MNIANLGHNNPPELFSGLALQEHLETVSKDLVARKDELINAAKDLPDVIDNDDDMAQVGDFKKLITAAVKNTEATRVSVKEPFLAGGRSVDGHFKAMNVPLEKILQNIEKISTTYLRIKEAEERRRRDEEAAKARAEAAAAAEEARRREEQIKGEKSLAAAIAAEEAAKQAEADAAAAQKSAEAKAADLTRVRGSYGSVTSLQKFWDFKDIDRDTIDLEFLRHHLPMDALEKAVRSAIKAGAREIKGVSIYENSRAATR